MKTQKKVWILALLFATVATVLFYQYLQQLRHKYEPDNLQKVVIASRDIQQDSTIGPDDVTTKKVPSEYVHARTYREREQVIGKVAISNITANEQVIRDRILNDNNRKQEMAYTVPAGKRAISVEVDDITGVSGFIRPNDRVDVLVTIDVPVDQQQTKTCTVLALQNLQVLATGSSLNGVPDSKGDSKNAVSKKTVTLAVDPRQGQVLTMATERGVIRLMLRPPAEHDSQSLPPFDLKQMPAVK
ncbi:MAG: Flp pilus assembly protein CpaB [Chitinophagales bacterium]